MVPGEAREPVLVEEVVGVGVSAKLVQLMTGLADTAARKRPVLPTIQAVSTPPPEPPVTKRLS